MVVFSSSKNGGNYGGHLLPGLTPGVLIVLCEKIQNTRSNSSKTILPSLKITKNHIEITKKTQQAIQLHASITTDYLLNSEIPVSVLISVTVISCETPMFSANLK